MYGKRLDLIVPIKDRRQHKRYLTLRNVGLAFAAVLLAFAGVSIYSELRHPAPNDYGRLSRRTIPTAPVKAKALDVVREEPPRIADETPVVPNVEPLPPVRSDVIATTAPSTDVVRGDKVAIVEGPGGVAIVQKKANRPVLGGGFGRP